MQFNSLKFELLRYGKNTQLKEDTTYVTPEWDLIEEKDRVRGLDNVKQLHLQTTYQQYSRISEKDVFMDPQNLHNKRKNTNADSLQIISAPTTRIFITPMVSYHQRRNTVPRSNTKSLCKKDQRYQQGLQYRPEGTGFVLIGGKKNKIHHNPHLEDTGEPLSQFKQL